MRKLSFIFSKLSALDDVGVHTVCAVLDAEYRRCAGKSQSNNSDTSIRGYNGIGYASSSEDTDAQEKRIIQIINSIKHGN